MDVDEASKFPDNLPAEDDWADSTLENDDWSTIDQEMFGADWVKEMEALEHMPTTELYYSQSSDGFAPNDWLKAHEAMEDLMNSLGMVGPKLLVQQGEELVLVTQLAMHLGLDLLQSQIEWHKRQLVKRIQGLVIAEPLNKRLRGELKSATHQHIQDVIDVSQKQKSVQERLAGSSSSAEVHDNWMIPEVGTRSQLGRTKRLTAGWTREQVDRLRQVKWYRAAMNILSSANAPVVQLARETSDPERILVGAVGSSRGTSMETYVKAIQVFLTWISVAYEQSWPTGLIIVIEFLHAAGTKPCSPSYPRRFLAALAWFENANAPVVMLASETSDPSRILQDAVGSSRGNLRLREHDVLDRMEAAHGRPQ